MKASLQQGWPTLLIAISLASCSGGGGGNSSGTSVPPTPILTSAPTVISGSVAELVSGAPLAGFTVSVGYVPDEASCVSGATAAIMPCGTPVAPIVTAMTAPSGDFTLSIPYGGTYMLTIGKDATYATLHRTFAANGTSLGILKVAALSIDEQAWLTDVNNQRATVSDPASFPNLVVDEYAEEQARAEVAAIVSGAQPYGDPTELMFGNLMLDEPGSMYGFRSVADLVNTASDYLQADKNWMSEKANCPNGVWETCTLAEDTGHYINISAPDDVWIGMGESATSYVYGSYGNEWAYAMLMPADITTSSVAPYDRRHAQRKTEERSFKRSRGIRN